MKIHFNGYIFEKYSNITYHKNVSSERLVVHADRRTRWSQ